jgi:hypothetical protein
MRRGTLSALATTIFLVLPPPELHAQVLPEMPQEAPSSRLVRVGFGGGVTVPVSDASRALENGLNGEAFILVSLGGFPPLRFNLGYQSLDLKAAAQEAQSGSTSILSGVAGLSIDLLPSGPIRPYVTAGLGAFRVKSDMEGAAPGAGESTSTEFGIDGGAGIVFRVGRLEGFVEARVQNVYTEAGLTDVGSLRTVPVTFGVLF